MYESMLDESQIHIDISIIYSKFLIISTIDNLQVQPF